MINVSRDILSERDGPSRELNLGPAFYFFAKEGERRKRAGERRSKDQWGRGERFFEAMSLTTAGNELGTNCNCRSEN